MDSISISDVYEHLLEKGNSDTNYALRIFNKSNNSEKACIVELINILNKELGTTKYEISSDCSKYQRESLVIKTIKNPYTEDEESIEIYYIPKDSTGGMKCGRIAMGDASHTTMHDKADDIINTFINKRTIDDEFIL